MNDRNFIDSFSVGDWVFHPRFGKGRVVALTPETNKVDVSFIDGDRYSLLPHVLCPIEQPRSEVAELLRRAGYNIRNVDQALADQIPHIQQIENLGREVEGLRIKLEECQRWIRAENDKPWWRRVFRV